MLGGDIWNFKNCEITRPIFLPKGDRNLFAPSFSANSFGSQAGLVGSEMPIDCHCAIVTIGIWADVETPRHTEKDAVMPICDNTIGSVIVVSQLQGGEN